MNNGQENIEGLDKDKLREREDETHRFFLPELSFSQYKKAHT